MNSYGLVLAGGGAKGAYQIGAWKALREMGITFDAIAGSSIGSINGALIAADDYEKARELWMNISIDKGLRINEELPDPENLFSKKNWGVLFKEVLKNGGLDASPAAEFISQYVDESKVRKNGIPLYAVAVQISQGVTPREICIDEIPEGKLTDYLMASSNIPLAVGIGPEGEKYLDGGAYDNIPLMTLKKRGYNRLIILDISNLKGVAHAMNTTNAQIVHIKPYNSNMLGGFMDLDAEAVEKRIQLGYYDAKKAFCQLLGNIYYFLPKTFRSMVKTYGADTVVNLEKLAFYLNLDPYRIYNENEFIIKVKELYEAEKLRLQEEAAALEEAEKERDRGRDRVLIYNALKKYFPQISAIEETDKDAYVEAIEGISEETAEEIAEEITADVPAEKASDFTSIFNAFRKHFPQRSVTEETTEKITEETAEETSEETADIPVEKGNENESFRRVFRKRFSQKNPLDEFTDAIAVLDGIIQ